MYKKRILLLFFTLFGYYCVAQKYELSGRIINAKTKEEVPFASIRINESNSGTTSDLNGFFKIVFKEPIRTLGIQSIGYESLIYTVKPEDKERLEIKLKPKPIELKAITIYPQENPAHRIIREVLKNRNKNNPEKQRSFTYTSYNIAKAEVVHGKSWDKVPDDYPKDEVLSKKDSNKIESKKAMKSMYVFVSESIIERKFKYPDRNYEEVVGSRTTGMKTPFISAMLTQMQSFSFYNDYFSILGTRYVNPICEGTFSRYYFEIRDTLYQGADTVFSIFFQPISKHRFKGLTGILYINTNQYAIQHVVVENYKDKALGIDSSKTKSDEEALELDNIPLQIKQHYQFVENQWFPLQAFFEIVIQIPSKDFSISFNVSNSYSKIQLNPELKNKEFSDLVFDVSPTATGQKDEFWLSYRDTLNEKILHSYQILDSIYSKINLDKWLFIFKTLTEGKITYKWIDFDLTKVFGYNLYEKFRFGLGIQTNDRLSKWFSVGGYGAYGFGDYDWKYSVFGEIYLDKFKSYVFKLSHANDLESSGKIMNFKPQQLLDVDQYQSYLDRRFENKRNIAASFSFPVVRYTKLEVGLDYSKKKSCYDYAFFTGKEFVNHYTFTDINVNLRFAFKEKKMHLGSGFLVSTKDGNYPVLNLYYTRGTNLLGGEYNYNRLVGKLTQDFDFMQWGVSHIVLMGGYVDPDLPYNRLFAPSGSKNNDGFFFENSFATMFLYDYLANSFVSAFLTHDFGKILWVNKYSSPEPNIKANLLWGNYTGKSGIHQNIIYRVPDKGYFETGLVVNKLFTYSTMALGGGAFYRINENYTSDVIDRFVFVWTLGVNF